MISLTLGDFSFEGSVAVIFLISLGLLCMFLKYGLKYLSFRNKLRILKNKKIVVSEYQAPPNIPPAFFGTMVDNRMSVQDQVATIIDLIYQGKLKVVGTQNNLITLQTTADPSTLEYEHQKVLLEGFVSPYTVQQYFLEMQTNYEFNFALQKDLQKTGYYHFHNNLLTMKPQNYVGGLLSKGIIKGLARPWNWPLFIFGLIYFPFFILWAISLIIYYNRIGIYNFRTDKWDDIWPKVAGYYSYLKVVEAEKRNFEIKQRAEKIQPGEHDAYLVAAQMQKYWSNVFGVINEIGAGGKEYDTI